VIRADVARRAELAGALAELDGAMPPLRGVIHAAGVLADRTIRELDAGRFQRVMAAKALGAWHLHELTRDRPLDVFVLYSSVVSLLGSPGQANYAAANAFLDALAHERRRLGLPGLAINWSAFSEVGMAAAQANRGERLASRGLGSLTVAQGHEVLERLWAGPAAQVAVVPLDVRQWLEFYVAADGPFWSELRDAERPAAAAAAHPLHEALRPLEPVGRRRVLERHVVEQLARVLRLEVDRIDGSKTMGELGLDSLMNLELRNRLEAQLGLALAPTLLFTYPTIAALSDHLLGALDLPAPAPPPPSAVAANARPDDARFAEAVSRMSDEEAERLLRETLEAALS
jgi:acyl carrier protein